MADAIKASWDLLVATWNKDENAVAKGIDEIHMANTSILEYNDENALSCVITLAYYHAVSEYTLIRELPSGKGFADVVFLPRRRSDKPAMVVELKYDQSVEGALHIRKCPFGRFREFVMTVGYEEFVGINILEETTMKSLFEQFGGTYRKESDYTIPNLKMPEADDMKIGIYGQRHLQFLQQHRRTIYISLLTSGNLNQYLAEIDRQAQERFSQMVEQMKQVQGITEQLKADTPMEWSKKMNCIRQQAEEVIFAELIYN